MADHPPAAGRAGTVAEVGEFGLIAAVAARLRRHPPVLLGPGDDAAVVAAPDGRVVASADLLVEGRHFRLDWTGGYDLGRRAAAQNLADIAAMGAVPTALLLGLACPGTTALPFLAELTDGLVAECDLVGASVVGGDVVAADTLTLAVTVLGDLQGRAPVRRAGARPGDQVVLAGRLGASAAGLALATAGIGTGDEAGADGLAGALLAAYRRPTPPYRIGPRLAGAGATAMIDVSDGLLADLGHVAEASAVAVVLDAAALTPDPDLVRAGHRLDQDPRVWVLTGGEDHALAAALPAGAVVPAGCRRIGWVAAGSGVRVPGWEPLPALAPGHDHFRPGRLG